MCANKTCYSKYSGCISVLLYSILLVLHFGSIELYFSLLYCILQYYCRFIGQGQGQGFFICHMINYTGYNQKWNVVQIRSAQWTVQRIKKKKIYI